MISYRYQIKQHTTQHGDRYITNIIQFPIDEDERYQRMLRYEVHPTPITTEFLLKFCVRFNIDYIEDFMHMVNYGLEEEQL